MSAVLEAQEVSRTFRLPTGWFREPRILRAVNDISLEIRRGEVLAIVGESGCGKSTLARILLGLIPPSSGSIRLNGVDLHKVERKYVARRVQPIFQDPFSSLNPRRTIDSIVSLPLDVHGIGTPAERANRVREMLDLVGLPSRFAKRYPKELSGGQRQRVAIARALIMKPDLVICDEPTSALDVSVQSQILNLLMDLQRELDLTYVFISHNLAVVEHIASRVAVMYLGKIVEIADSSSLFSTPRHPYTQALLSSVLTPEPGLGVPDAGLGSSFPNPLNLPSGCAFHPRCPKRLPGCEASTPALRYSPSSVACHLWTEE